MLETTAAESGQATASSDDPIVIGPSEDGIVVGPTEPIDGDDAVLGSDGRPRRRVVALPNELGPERLQVYMEHMARLAGAGTLESWSRDLVVSLAGMDDDTRARYWSRIREMTPAQLRRELASTTAYLPPSLRPPLEPDARPYPAGSDEPETPRLRLVPEPTTDKPVDAGDPAPTDTAETETSVPFPSLDKENPVTTPTMSGETTTIDATRAYLGELATHVGSQIQPQLELCQAHLQKADLDPTTLGHLAQALEQFQVAQATVTAALDALNSQHALMEEAVNNTQHAAERDYYKHH